MKFRRWKPHKVDLGHSYCAGYFLASEYVTVDIDPGDPSSTAHTSVPMHWGSGPNGAVVGRSRTLHPLAGDTAGGGGSVWMAQYSITGRRTGTQQSLLSHSES